MRTQQEITEQRLRLVVAVRDFSDMFDLELSGSTQDPLVVHYMALGALGFASWALKLEKPDNFQQLLRSMEAAIRARSFDLDHNGDEVSE